MTDIELAQLREEIMTKTAALAVRWADAKNGLDDSGRPTYDLMAVKGMTGSESERLDAMRAAQVEIDTLTARLDAAKGEAHAATPVTGLPLAGSFAGDGESAEVKAIAARTSFAGYVMAALNGVSEDGAEAEFNRAIGIRPGFFPVRALARNFDIRNAAIDGDAGATQASWVDRVFAGSAAAYAGVSFLPVSPGVHAVPVTTVGATGAQRARTQAADDTAYTVNVSELKPKRNTAHTIFSMEDDLRLSGQLASALVRDLAGSVVAAVDKAIFVGDAGGTGTEADITGLSTTASVTERTITQANKITASGVLSALAALVDGVYASSFADLRPVLTVGANTLWVSTVPNAATGNNANIAQVLRDNGLDWRVKGDLETNTGNGKFGGFVGRAAGIDRTAVAAIWEEGRLYRDDTSMAKSGEVQLALSTFWDFAVTRPAQWGRIKFVQ